MSTWLGGRGFGFCFFISDFTIFKFEKKAMGVGFYLFICLFVFALELYYQFSLLVSKAVLCGVDVLGHYSGHYGQYAS